MAFNEAMAGRIRQRLARRKNVEEKKMFGCVCFLLNGNALAGVWKDKLIARIGPDEGKRRCESRTSGRSTSAVEPQGVEDDDQLTGWIERAVKFVRALSAKEK